jgi:signal transduction histidine kinase
MKQLLFASVSHDLKSPLNAVLGFAELVRSEDLSQAQLESIDMVSSRGRELLALIETILDAARVDAGQMQLLRQPSDAESLIRGAVDKAFDLHAGSPSEVLVEVAPAMPVLDVDPNHAARAVAVLIAHAMSSAGPQAGRVIQVRGSVPASRLSEGSGMARIHIEYAAADSRPSLLEAQLAGKVPSSTGRGMVLRLSLARSIIELHGGRVEVGRGTHGAATVTCWLPTA